MHPPPHTQATLFATLMSVLNCGSITGSALGAGLTNLYGVTSDKYDNLFALVSVWGACVWWGGGCKDVWKSGTGCTEDCRRSRCQLSGGRDSGRAVARQWLLRPGSEQVHGFKFLGLD